MTIGLAAWWLQWAAWGLALVDLLMVSASAAAADMGQLGLRAFALVCAVASALLLRAVAVGEGW